MVLAVADAGAAVAATAKAVASPATAAATVVRIRRDLADLICAFLQSEGVPQSQK
jgi:hypothetical protein